MDPSIPTLTPHEVKESYLKPGHPFGRQSAEELDQFNIVSIRELLPYIKFPNPPFRNTSTGFILLQRGTIDFQINGMDYQVFPNQFILTPAGQINSILSISSDVVGIMGTFANYFIEESRTANSWYSILNPDYLPHFQLNADNLPILTSICERLVKLYKNSSAGRSHLIRQYLTIMLQELELMFRREQKIQLSNGFKLTLDFKKLLTQKIRLNPKPADFAMDLHVSVNHLNKVLQQTTKCSTRDWIVKRQIAEAKMLLKYTAWPISQVAFTMGFEDPSYFSKFFHRSVGRTPTQYRND